MVCRCPPAAAAAAVPAMAHVESHVQAASAVTRPLKVIVVGAGIAGLTAGLGLQRLGHQVVILEQAAELSDVGAGIQMAPNGARILDRLGVLQEVMKDASNLERISIR